MSFALRQYLPSLTWLPSYGKDQLGGDLTAGLTVGVMLIPQGMAYALIAGLPPIYGLYASLAPLIVYAFFGTSRQLAVGPVAMISLLVAAGITPLAGGDAARHIELALVLAVMVGLFQFVLGLARFGFLSNFMSHSVLTGFTAAAALIIGLSQLKHLLGVPLSGSSNIFQILGEAWGSAAEVHLLTVVIGLTSIALVWILRKRRPRWPGGLAAVALSTLVVWGFHLADAGVRVVGDIPGGLPGLAFPVPSLDTFRALLPTALTITLIGFTESIAVAKVYATKNRYEVDANQELVALGLANLIGGFLMAYPTTGGFSRTAVNAQAGARTNLAAVFSAGLIGLTLLFLTPLFYYMPQAVLAAVVMVAVIGLIDFKEVQFLWRADRRDLVLMAITFGATLWLGIEEGILVGVVSSLAMVLHEGSNPHTAVMGRIPGSDVFRNILRHPNAIVQAGVVIFRMDANLYFFNAGYLRERINTIVASDPALHTLILDAYPVNQIDASGIHALREVLETLRRQNIRLLVSGVKGPVMDKLQASGLAEAIGVAHFFMEPGPAAAFACPNDAPAIQPYPQFTN
ncbi:MAG: solute carrier family 26 protein [Rhodothermales bacterium]|nr:solute carrier family 26 protein [Rhodothermales bacterium]